MQNIIKRLLGLKEKPNFKILDDLGFELRMLMGSNEALKVAQEKKLGNIGSLLIDSGYLHARNLYNFFDNRSENDYHVNNFTDHKFKSRIYIKWKSILHDFVLHIKEERTFQSNTIKGININTQIPIFTSDLIKIWKEWISITNDLDLRNKLEFLLDKAIEESSRDYKNFNFKLK